MKPTTIEIDSEQARRLRYLALREHCSFGEVVQRALEEHLLHHGLEPGFGIGEPQQRMSEEEWRAGFEAAVQRVRASVDPTWTPEKIEADITAAQDEVRRERAARRRAASA